MPLQTRSLRRLPIVLGTCALLACALTAQAADREAMLSAAVRIRYERYQDGAVITGHGTAFGADLSAWGFPGRRYLLSAAHNVLNDEGRPFTTLKIEVVDGPRTYWLGARTLVFDENLDLCILEAGDDLPVLGRLAVKDLRGGERAILAGSPRGTPVALYEGLMREPFYRGSVRSAVSVAFDHGCSGGPLYGAESGEVVGVAVAGIPKDGDMDHQLGLFVPVVGLRSFLEAHRRGPAVSSPEPVLAATRVVRPEPRVLPVEEPAPAPVVREETPKPPANRPPQLILSSQEVSAATPQPEPRNVQAPPSAPLPAPEPSGRKVYVVQPGDNLTTIARRHGVSLKSLMAANPQDDPNLILIGQRLLIPGI